MIFKQNSMNPLQQRETQLQTNSNRQQLEQKTIKFDKQKKLNNDTYASPLNKGNLPSIAPNFQTPIYAQQKFQKNNFFQESHQNYLQNNFFQESHQNNLQNNFQSKKNINSKCVNLNPIPQKSIKNNGFINLVLQNTKFEDECFNEQNFNKQNQLQAIVDSLREKYGNQQITLQYENRTLNPENSLIDEIKEVRDTMIIKFTISSKNEETLSKLANSNFTIPTVRKQYSQYRISEKNLNFTKQDDKVIQYKTDHYTSFLSDQKIGDYFEIQNSIKTENSTNKYVNQSDQTNIKQNLQIETNSKNYRTNKRSIFSENKTKQSQQNSFSRNSQKEFSPDSQDVIGFDCDLKKFQKYTCTRQPSMVNIQNKVNYNQSSENHKRLRIVSNPIHQIGKIKNSEQKYNEELLQIQQNNFKNIMVKCQNQGCRYFCILSIFANQNYFCQSCEKFSVKVDLSTLKFKNSCNHTLNYMEITTIVQNAIQKEQFALCGCKQEINYSLIKNIDTIKQYFNLRLKLMAEKLKNQIIKSQQHQIAQCVEPECEFFTIWNPNQPLLKQGFCHLCCKRTAFYMLQPQNTFYKINCGHELTTQKLLGLASDAQLQKTLAKCSTCQQQIELKFYNKLGQQGDQYKEHAYNYQLDILKKQFKKMIEIVVIQCSTLSCKFFYVFQNKTIQNSKGEVVFSQQYNLDNSKIFSYCPNCNDFSTSNEWKEKTNLRRQANRQFIF